MYFRGIHVNEFFRIHRRKAIVIGCSSYDKLRQIEGFEGFQDIPESLEDVKFVKTGLRHLHFKMEDISVLTDPSWVDIKLELSKTGNDIVEKYEHEQLNTLLFVYYAGHGSMKNSTSAMLNSEQKNRCSYNLELTMRTLARTTKGSYVIGVFDCCRE